VGACALSAFENEAEISSLYFALVTYLAVSKYLLVLPPVIYVAVFSFFSTARKIESIRLK
jgi:hypothetical protein